MDNLLTTRQIQELIRVDRITVYRMLKDGRLRGFKVGGQWRFPRRDIEAWLQEQQAGLGGTSAALLPTDSSAPLSQALPIGCTTAIQGLCAEMVDVAVVTTDLDGRPLSGVSNPCAFCSLVLSTEAGRQSCASSWRQRPDGEIYACHAGLLCASAVIAIGGQPVGLAAACQFTTAGTGEPEPGWQADLTGLAAGLGVAESDLKAAADSVRAISESDRARISKLVRRLAEAFSEIGQERLYLLGRLEKIAEMSRL